MDNKKFTDMLRKAATESQPSPTESGGGTGGTSRFRQMLEAATTERRPFPTVANPISASGKDTAKKRNNPDQLTDRERQQRKSRGLAMEKLLRDTANNPDARLNVGADYYISRFENSQKARGISREKVDAYGKIGSTVGARPSGDGMDDIRGYYYGEDREEERAKIRDWLTGKGYDGIVNQMRQYDDLYRGRDAAARNYRNAEDFERVSAVRNAEQYNGDAILNYVNALNSGSEHGESPVNDLLALSKRYNAGTLPELHGGTWGTDDPYAYILSNDTRADLHHLSADEEQMYYYILNKHGAGAAREYLNSIASLTNMRAQQAMAEKVGQMNSWEAALYSAASVPARALGTLFSVGDKIEQLGQGKIGYSRNQSLTNLADVIRSETAGRLDEATGGANLFGFGAGDVYQALMSGADSAFGAGAFGQGYTALMGLGAASAEAEKLTRAGASEGQIIAGALTAGAAETVFEYASIEHLIKMRDPQTIAQAVKNALVQGGIEASEEVFTELSNMITNGIIMGSQSDFEQGIQALMAQGKSRAAATAEYIASSLYEAGMGGFISGGAAGGSTVADAVLDNAGQTRQVGNAIRSTEGGVDALKVLAQQVAEKKGNRQERGIVRQVERTEKKTTDRSVGKLSNKIDRYRATQNRSDIAKVLQEKGGLSGIRAISAAQTVGDVLDGNADELTQERFEKLMENEKVAAAVNELWSPTSSVAVRNRSHALTRMGGSAEDVAEINNAIEAITKGTGEEADVQKAMEKAQEGYETSGDGETFIKETGLKADGMKIVGRENGKLMVEVQTEEGTQIVPASEISYASEEQAKIFGTLDLGGIDAESAQAIAHGYTSGTNVDNYLMGTDLAYRNGKYNLREGMEQVAELIGTEAAENAWQRGRITALEAARAQSTTTGKKTGGVSYEGDRSGYSNLSDVQNASVKVLDKLGKALGINYHLYKSYAKDGKRVYEHNGEVVAAPNGYFVTESGEIYIDINAGDNGEGVILWTAAHEMVHDMRRNNGEGFNKLADFLFTAIEKEGVSVHNLALEQMVRDKNLTEEAAMEEVVADAMMEMLTREDAAEQVRKLKTEDKGLWRKLRDVFKDLAKKLHALYQQFAPQSHEAQIVRQMEQAVQDRLAELFYEGVATAAENRNAETEAQKTDDVLGQDATGYSETIEDEAKFSTRYDEEYMNAADQYNKTHGAVDQRLMDKARKDRAKLRKEMEALLRDDKIGLPPDIEGDTFFADSSYGGSEENTTVCPRSLAAEAFVDEVSKFVGRPLTVAEQLIICQDLQNRMKNPECLYCYVATDRKAYREFLGEYLKQRDRVLDAYRNGETDTSRSGNLYKKYMLNTVDKNGKKKKRKDTDPMWGRFNMWINAEKNGGRMISSADLASIHDLQELSMDKNGELYEQLSDAMAYAQAASWAKKRVGYVAYNNHILKWKQSRIDILNSMYGLRFYSFSDFSPAFILENMQMVTDAAARALKSLAYTKDLDFVRIFAKTHMNINVSVFGFESEDGGCVPNEIIGANWAEAQKLREQYENVGCTFVATSDRLVEWALEQDWIDVVIPYHLVRTGEEVRKALGYTNYTKESSDKKIKGKWNKDANEAHISPVQHDNDLGKYLAALKQNNLKPRFERWIKNPNYMKLVNETRLSVSESKPLVPVFDMDAAMESLAKLKANGYYTPVGGNYETMQNLALAMADTIYGREKAAAENVKFSNRNTEQRDADYMAAVKAGDMETAQKMVDEAARAAGYTLKKYHETKKENIIHVFDLSRNTNSSGDRQTPFGIFTKSHDRSVGLGGKQMRLFVKANRIFAVENRDEIERRLPIEYSEMVRRLDNLGEKFWEESSELEDEEFDAFDEWLDEQPDGEALRKMIDPTKEFTEQPFADRLSEKVKKASEAYKEHHDKFAKAELDAISDMRAFITNWMRNNGYDAMELKYDNGAGNRVTDALIVLDENQVKLADPVTYDDNGNVIPISERFNPEKKDIRYSQRGGAVTTRDMLTLMDAETVKNADEKRRLTEYQEKAAAYDEQQYIIATLTEDLREIRRGKGKRNMDIVRDLQVEISKAENRANLYAGQMARLENGTFIQRILNRNLREQNGVAAAKEAELNRTAEQLRRENQRLQTELYSSKVEALAESALREQEFNERLLEAGRSAEESRRKQAQDYSEKLSDAKKENAALGRTADRLRQQNQRLESELYAAEVEAKAKSALREQEFNDQLRAAREDYQERSKKKAAEVNERIQKLREEFRSRRAKELQERREKYENSLREMREGFKERSKQRTAEFNERLQKVREGYQESRKRDVEKRGNTVIRHKIAKLENDLRKQLLKPSEGHYVPKELVGSTIDLLNAINMDSGRSERVAEKIAMIRSKYDALKSDEKYAMYHDQVFSDALQKLVESIGDTSVAKMDRKQLEDVYDIMKAMHKTIRDAVKVTIGKEEYNAYQLAKQAINETMAVKTKDSLAAHWVGKQLRAETAFERFGGFAKDSAWSKLAKLLNDGQLKQTKITMEASQIFAALVNDKQAKTLLDTGDKATVDIGLKDENGNAVRIPRGMMLSVYMHLQNDQNARHLALGGFTLPGIKAYYKGDMGKAWGSDHGSIPGVSAELTKLGHQIENETDEGERAVLEQRYEELAEDLLPAAEEYTNRLSAAIEKQLTEYERKWIAAAKKFFDGYSRRVLNEATEQMYHFSKANVQNYYPIRTDPNYRQANFESITKDMSLENSGFMKERVAGASNPILLEDITDVINGQVRRVAAYAGLAPAIRNFQKVYGKVMKNYQNSLQNALAKKFGENGKDYVENLLADLTGSRRSEGTIFDALRGNMAGATLSLNPRVALAQAASFPTAAAELGVAPLAKALAKGGKNGWMFSAADRELIMKYSPLLWYRMQGYRDTEIGDLKASQQFMAQANKKLRWALGWIQAMDGATVGRLWYAAQYYVDDHFGELEKGSDAYYQRVAEVFNRVVEKTQPNYTVMQRPDILRDPNALYKQLTMFMTQRLQNFNIVYEGLGRWKKYSSDYKYGRNGVTKADLAEARNTALRSVGSQVAAAATIAVFKLAADALTHSMGAYRDDDEELTGSSIVLELVNIFADSIISSTLWGSEFSRAVKYVIALYKGESASFDMMSISGIENLVSTLQSVIDSASGVGKLFDPDQRGSELKAMEKAALAISQAFGLPLKNAKKLVKGAIDTATEAANGEAWQSHGVTRTRAQNKNLLYKFMAAGQTEEAEKIAATFGTDKKLHDAIREALREHDDRIAEGGKAWAEGDIDTYLRLADEIEAEGAFERDDIISAMKTIKGQFEDSGEEKTDASKPAPGTAEDVVDAITSGQKGAADKLMSEIVKYKADGGKSEDEAKKSLAQSISTSIKDRTEIGTLTAEQAAELLVSYCGLDKAAALAKARYWRFDATSVYDWSQNEFEDYDEIKNKGISEAKFDQFLSATRGITSIEGGATKKEQILAAINKMPLTVAQKDALYYLKGYAESKIVETPWH